MGVGKGGGDIAVSDSYEGGKDRKGGEGEGGAEVGVPGGKMLTVCAVGGDEIKGSAGVEFSAGDKGVESGNTRPDVGAYRW